MAKMGEDVVLLIGTRFLLLLAFIKVVNADDYCGNGLYCRGAGSYCCGQHCCSSVWTVWWFWTLFAGVFCLVGVCTYICRRYYSTGRYSQPRYIVVQDTSVLAVHPEANYQAYGAVGTVVPTTTAPPKPPPYAAPSSKPPGYTPQ